MPCTENGTVVWSHTAVGIGAPLYRPSVVHSSPPRGLDLVLNVEPVWSTVMQSCMTHIVSALFHPLNLKGCS